MGASDLIRDSVVIPGRRSDRSAIVGSTLAARRAGDDDCRHARHKYHRRNGHQGGELDRSYTVDLPLTSCAAPALAATPAPIPGTTTRHRLAAIPHDATHETCDLA
jgi:hypothetical protein